MNDRTAHMDLLDQVERDQATRDAVRRMLAEPLPLTEADLDAHERWKRQPWPIGAANHAHRHSRPLTDSERAELLAQRQADVTAAIDARAPKCQACARGSRPCPTPDACYLSSQADAPRPPPRRGDRARVALLFLVGCAALGAALIAAGVHL